MRLLKKIKSEMSEITQLNKFVLFSFCIFGIVIPSILVILGMDAMTVLSEFSGGMITSLLALLITEKVGIQNKKIDEMNRKKDNDSLIKRINWELESNSLKLNTFINANEYEHNIFHIENINTTVWEKTNYKVELKNELLELLHNLYVALNTLRYSCSKHDIEELKDVSLFICNMIKRAQNKLSHAIDNSDEE